MIIKSEASRISKLSNNDVMRKQNNKDLFLYTNEHRDEPEEDFFEDKKEAIQHILDIYDEDKESRISKIVEEKKKVVNENEKVQEPAKQTPEEMKSPKKDETKKEKSEDLEDDFEEDEEDDMYSSKVEDTSTKNKLNAKGFDVISDFDEKTKGRMIEIYKKNTKDFEKEEVDNFNNDLSIQKQKKKDNEVFIQVNAKVKRKNYYLNKFR
jgi:hypothetical protein